MTIKSKTFGTLCGSYGKGIAGSLTINFGVSGGKNCDTSCPLHPDNGGGCYAVTAGARKPSITVNLERKESRFTEFLHELALNREKIAQAPWVRFSSFGSVPAPNTWTAKDKALLSLIAAALDHSKVHFPVETVEKAQALRELGFFPRVSDGQAEEAKKLGFPVSVVVQGEKVITGSMKRERIIEVTKTAHAKLRADGGKACPAILGNAKCGACKMCAGNSGVDTIGYFRHV